MKLLIDFFPIILFFVAFKIWGIYVATGVAIAATVAADCVPAAAPRQDRAHAMAQPGRHRGVWRRHAVAHNETFIKWKPTVLYWLMGGALLVGQLVLRKNLIKSLMGARWNCPRRPGTRHELELDRFFAAMGALNLWVAYEFDTETWVNFKLFGGLGLMLVSSWFRPCSWAATSNPTTDNAKDPLA
jgi:intracellular septation protein